MAEARGGEQKRVDPKNGFCPETKTFHSIRPPVALPPLSQPLSVTELAMSLLQNSPTGANLSGTAFLIDSATGDRLTYGDFLRRVKSLSLSLRTKFPSLSKNDVAFVLAPSSLHVPVVYFSLLSLGIVVSPANPLSSASELTHLLRLSKPSIAFATSSTAGKLPPSLPTILIDSPLFLEMLTAREESPGADRVVINQLDPAAILYSSGTTGRIKGAELSHRNFIAVIAGQQDRNKYGGNDELQSGVALAQEGMAADVSLFPLPLFHVFGFFMLIRAAALGDTLVMMGRFDFVEMLKAVEKYKVTYMPVSPPLVVALAKSEVVGKFDLSSLQLLGCGGAPLGEEVSERFKSRFPHVDLIQGYGLTETGGSATRMVGPEEATRYGSAGRLSENFEAKIIDPESGEALPPGQRGELWLRGPTVMKAYVGDEAATAATLDSEGWLRTGDLCYFDSDGFLYIVDRLKELIKYKAYQVPPAELEHLLQSMPDVADAAVIPYPDEEAGQIPMAYIVRKPGSNISETQVMDSIAKQVAPYKKIRRVAFINAIPKSPAGKILRRELILLAVSGASAKL